MNASDAPILFVVPGDLHLTEPDRDNHRVALQVIEQVNRLIRPDFVQFIGDNVQDATEAQFRLFDELRGSLTVPHFALIGDHDVHDDPDAERFRRHVGPTHGAFSLRGFRFLRLNTREVRPLGILPEQLAWFHKELDGAQRIGERVIVFQHNYPYQLWEDYDGPGLDDWRVFVQERRITAIVTGHTHYFQTANDGRNVSIAVRSIGDPEGGAPGYLLGFAQGDDFAAVYRAADERGPVVLITHPRAVLLATGPRHIVRGMDRVEVRMWSAGAILAARFRIDDGDWSDLERHDDGLWTGPIPGCRLAKGEHVLEVQAGDENGEPGGQRIEFMVDPTGRYTPVPAVWPRVTETAFC